MKKRLAVGIIFSMMVLALSGCGDAANEDTQNVSEVTEISTDSDANEDEVINSGIMAGTIYDNVYTNESFNFQFIMPEGWKFYDAATVANSTGVDEAVIEGFWKGTESAYDYAMSYCMIACDSTKGTSVIVSYFCPERYNLLPDTTAKEYLTNSAKGFEDAKIYDDKLGSMDMTCLELAEREDSKQYMYATDRDGIILMITFTTLTDEDIDTYKAMIK